MKPLINGKEVGGGNLVEKQSLADVKALWGAWEIHCLILASLFLQIFLFLTAGMRKRSASRFLSKVLWLAYLSADSVGIFVLGHLAVRAREARHQLMSFWAPFVLVHLGGQDTITAFAKQDNELWGRHLLSLVTQVAVAGYVVAKASWPDRRLRAAMVIMFLSGSLKYAERTFCLFLASPAKRRWYAVRGLKRRIRALKDSETKEGSNERARKAMSEAFDMLSKGTTGPLKDIGTTLDVVDDIMSVDVPLNDYVRILAADDLPGMLTDFLSREGRCAAYEHVGAYLEKAYRYLYTKQPVRELLFAPVLFWNKDSRSNFLKFLMWRNHTRRPSPRRDTCPSSVSARAADARAPLDHAACGADEGLTQLREVGPRTICFLSSLIFCLGSCLVAFYLLLIILLYYVSTPIALVLFMAAEKGDQLHTSRADITVTYILLVGAIVLDVSSAIMFIPSVVNLPAVILRVAHYIRPAWSRKQWSEELAQYSIIKRRIVRKNKSWWLHPWQYNTAGMANIPLGKYHTPILPLSCPVWAQLPLLNIMKDHTPIKEFVLDNLLRSGISKEWNIASSRGQLALQKRMDSIHPDGSDSAWPGKAVLDKSIGVDFPTSVLIWHIATDICYHYCGDNASTDSDQMKKDKQMSRELSNYIMYLVFKCGVMLTTNLQYVHDKAQDEISTSLSDQHVNLVEKDAVMKLFEANKKEEQQDHWTTVEIQGNEEPADNHGQSAKLAQSAQALDSPVLPRACEVAQELIRINDEAGRWGLIAGIWSEMLYYIAPRCGGTFHYEYLSTGGEFITHVLVLMRSLGPFLPPPAA